MAMIHRSHPYHQLELKHFEKPYPCDGCKQRGFGSRYRCDLCDFQLHEECMFASPTAHHDFLKNSAFILLYEPPAKKCLCVHDCRSIGCCDACGQPVKGFVYHDNRNNWNLHPPCLGFPRKVYFGDVRFKLCEKVSSKCQRCNMKKPEGAESEIRGWSYVSKCKKYHFHVNCFREMYLECRENCACQDYYSLALEHWNACQDSYSLALQHLKAGQYYYSSALERWEACQGDYSFVLQHREAWRYYYGSALEHREAWQYYYSSALEHREACQGYYSFVLEHWELHLLSQNRNRKNGKKMVRIMIILFKAVADLLLSEPTISLTSLAVESLAKGIFFRLLEA